MGGGVRGEGGGEREASMQYWGNVSVRDGVERIWTSVSPHVLSGTELVLIEELPSHLSVCLSVCLPPTPLSLLLLCCCYSFC